MLLSYRKGFPLYPGYWLQKVTFHPFHWCQVGKGVAQGGGKGRRLGKARALGQGKESWERPGVLPPLQRTVEGTQMGKELQACPQARTSLPCASAPGASSPSAVTGPGVWAGTPTSISAIQAGFLEGSKQAVVELAPLPVRAQDGLEHLGLIWPGVQMP